MLRNGLMKIPLSARKQLNVTRLITSIYSPFVSLQKAVSFKYYLLIKLVYYFYC
jgi:hypothetical protein